MQMDNFAKKIISIIPTIELFKLPLVVKFCYIEFEKAFDSINTRTCEYATRHKRYKIDFLKIK